MSDPATPPESPFSRSAAYYDLLYQDKDYDREAEFLIESIRRWGVNPVASLLDLGCGTGGHLMRFAERGWRLAGVDASAAMLEVAHAKLDGSPVPVRLDCGDMRDIDLGERFDVCTSMFAAFGYLPDDRALHDALRTVRDHLVPGGLFVMDVWHGPAVELTRPSVRRRELAIGGVQLRRTATPELDEAARIVSVQYDVEVEAGGSIERFTEVHRMRYFFAGELGDHLEGAGLEPLRLCAFPDLDAEPDEQSWNLGVVARAR